MPRLLSPVLLVLLLAAACSGSTPTTAAVTETPTPVVTTEAPSPTPAATTPAPSPSASPSPTARPTVRTSRSASPAASPRASLAAVPAFKRAFPVRGCKVSYARSHHDYPATDIFAAKGCAVVAPVTGRVDEVSAVDRWSSATNRGADRGGLSFSIVGDDGVRYYGSHLSALRVHAGQRVVVGQLIGAVGNTGDARGIATHVHFGLSWPTRPGIWWVRRGEVYPWSYLDSWRVGGSRSPAAAVAAAHRRLGDVPPCRIDC